MTNFLFIHKLGCSVKCCEWVVNSCEGLVKLLYYALFNCLWNVWSSLILQAV